MVDMDECTKDGKDEAKKLMDFYIDLVENSTITVKYYLGDNVVLDWFGKTIKGSKNVTAFIKDQVCKITHHMTEVLPAESIAFKESHKVKASKGQNVIITESHFPVDKDANTPPKQLQPSTSTIEMGQGDGLHNGNGPSLISPPKKIKLESSDEENNEVVEGEEVCIKIKYLTGQGNIQFHKPSYKKLQTESKWSRPTKLHLGYTEGSFKSYTIYLIIYEGNLKCRRNLLKSFCESESSHVD